MLAHLLIKNYALIEHLELVPDPGLNIVTGETGAGKSIMLGAIGLLMGNRADVKALYDAGNKCIVEGTFEIRKIRLKELFEEEDLDYSDTSIIRREISPSGKSRAFINDTPVPLDVLKRITSRLMDVHSQHDTLLLGQQDYQLSVVDAYARTASLLASYQSAFRDYRRSESKLRELQANAVQLKNEFDYNQFLLNELADANLSPDEVEKLEHELVLLENASEIRDKLGAITGYLDAPEQSVLDALKSVSGILSGLSKIVADFSSLRDRVNSVQIELKDVAAEIAAETDNTEVNPERLDFIQQRLNLLFSLMQKHQVQSIPELVAIRVNLEEKVGKVISMDQELLEAQDLFAKKEQEMLRIADQLSKARKEVIQKIEEDLAGLLTGLGLPNGKLSVSQKLVKPGPDGQDEVSFLFSANKGVAPKELRQVASGGEFSRLMLAIKFILAGKQQLPTIIFDEIDTGISGEIALRVAEMIDQMAKSHQVITITHLHQLASKGKSHYFVYKDDSADKTISRIRKLSPEERINEIAQMIGGNNPSATAKKSARELLAR